MTEQKLYTTEPKKETAVLVGLIESTQVKAQAYEYLAELAFLAETAGAQTVEVFTQQLEHPDNRTFVGKGKLQEIAQYILEHEVNIVIFDDELSPKQIRNIEIDLKEIHLVENCKVLDRTNLILDIFAQRAKTAQAKIQVELAQNEYLLPRLTGLWTHLSRQKGGIGMKGPGETEIETDRRVLRDRISLLKTKLVDIDKQFVTQRKNRSKQIRVALIGYTNVGKSTLMNELSKANVFAENKLFATLDTTVRKVVYEQVPFLLSDTVGFIRKLPHHLVESFKSTLDEVREADLLLHVVDVSHPTFEAQMHAVAETLKEMKVVDKKMIVVFNKIDLIKKQPDNVPDHVFSAYDKQEMTLEELEQSWIAKSNGECIFVSAQNRQNLDGLRKRISDVVVELWNERYPFTPFVF